MIIGILEYIILRMRPYWCVKLYKFFVLLWFTNSFPHVFSVCHVCRLRGSLVPCVLPFCNCSTLHLCLHHCALLCPGYHPLDSLLPYVLPRCNCSMCRLCLHFVHQILYLYH